MSGQNQPDRFVGAQIEREATHFDATQYSFFDLPASNGVAAGALEDGLEAPPDEEGLLGGLGGLEDELEPDGLKDEAEDYTVAGMFSEARPRPGMPAEDDLDESAELEAAMSRSLPRHMFGDDDSPPGLRRKQGPSAISSTFQQAGSMFSTPQARAASRPVQLTPPHTQPAAPQDHSLSQPRKPTPMTLAELEAEMQASNRAAPTTPLQPPMPPHGPHPGIGPAMSHGAHPPMHTPPSYSHMGGPGGPPPFSHPLQPSPMGLHGPHAGPVPPPPGMRAPPPGFMHGAGPHHMHMPPPGSPLIQHPQGLGERPPFMHQQFPHPHPMMMDGRTPPGLHPGPMTPPMHHGPPGMHPPPRMPMPYGGHTPVQQQQSMMMHHPGHGPPPPGFPGAPLFHHPGGTPPLRPMPGGGTPGSAPRAPMMISHMMGSPGLMGPPRPRVMGGAWMTAQEVEHVMHIMYAAVHTGVPYVEDYYYQAFVHQATNGRNAAIFKPEALRSLRADVIRLDPGLLVRHAAVEGLGKIVLSNIRTPKMLMDLTSAPEDRSTGATSSTVPETAAPHRPLEQEPILAARIMVEDCHDKLLDIDDIDRCFAAAAATNRLDFLPDDPTALKQRRALLATSVINAFRLPTQPAGGDSTTSSDAVFLNLMTLPKGRSMLARCLRVLLARSTIQLPSNASRSAGAAADKAAAGPGSGTASEGAAGPVIANPAQLLWALLRNFHQVWGSSISDPDIKPQVLSALMESSHKLAAAAKEALHHVSTQQDIMDMLTALQAGLQARTAVATGPNASLMDSLLPLAQVRKMATALSESTPSDWLGDVLVGLVQRGMQLMPDVSDLSDASANGNSTEAAGSALKLAKAWQEGVSVLIASFSRHIAALATLQSEMNKQADMTGGSPAPEAVQAVRGLACRPLAQQLLGCMQDVGKQEQLKQQLRVLL